MNEYIKSMNINYCISSRGASENRACFFERLFGRTGGDVIYCLLVDISREEGGRAKGGEILRSSLFVSVTLWMEVYE